MLNEAHEGCVNKAGNSANEVKLCHYLKFLKELITIR